MNSKLPRYPFAPGVIEPAPTASRYWRWTDLIGSVALVAAAAFVAGWLL